MNFEVQLLLLIPPYYNARVTNEPTTTTLVVAFILHFQLWSLAQQEAGMIEDWDDRQELWNTEMVMEFWAGEPGDRTERR